MSPLKPWQIVTIVLASIVAVAVALAVIVGIAVGIGLTARGGMVETTVLETTMTQIGNDLP